MATPYANQPLILAAWRERWRVQGASAEEVKAKLGKILRGADPPNSEAEVISLLDGVGQPIRLFCKPLLGSVAGSLGFRERRIRDRSGAKFRKTRVLMAHLRSNWHVKFLRFEAVTVTFPTNSAFERK
jgi:hypothetical protein